MRVYNLNEMNYPTVFNKIETVGFSTNNDLTLMQTLNVIDKVIKDACWYAASQTDIDAVKAKLRTLIQNSPFDISEVINDIYKNINQPQTNVEFELYKDSIMKYNLTHKNYKPSIWV